MSKTFLLSVYNGNSGGKRIRGGLGRVAMQLGMAITVVCVLLFAVRVVLAAPTYAGPISVTANMGNFSPTAVRVANSATSSLSAYYLPPSGMPEGQLSASYDWSVSSVQYKALQADSFGSPPANSYSDSISPAQPSANSGATLTFTPEIAGYWQVSTICSVIVTDTTTNQYWSGSANAGPVDLMSFTIDITYTGPVYNSSGDTSDAGTVVTNQQVNVHAGWPIQLGAVHVLPADVTAFTWTISGAGGNGSAAINGYIVTNAYDGTTLVTSTGTVYPLVPGSDTSATFPDPSSYLPTTLKSYYYTQSGSFTASVAPEGSADQGAKTTFVVTEPTPTFSAQYDANTEFTQPATGCALLHLFSAAANDGVLFEHQPVHGATFGGVTYSGHSYFVQVYTENDLWVPININDASFPAVGSGVDVVWPYPNVGTFNGNVYTNDAPDEAADSYWGFMEIDDTPDMWLMYTPAVTGSIDVPLDSAPWTWGGTVTGNGTAWTLDTINPNYATLPQPVPGVGSTDIYPVWSYVLEPPAPPH